MEVFEHCTLCPRACGVDRKGKEVFAVLQMQCL